MTILASILLVPLSSPQASAAPSFGRRALEASTATETSDLTTGGEVGHEFPEAAGRGPVCAVALRLGGRVELDELRATLATFLAHRPGFRKEWHKALCHASPEGFGSHYLFFDYLFAAEAARALPRPEFTRARHAILEDVLAERFADGSFEDIPSLGRPYGTAMPLLAFRELR